MNKNTFITTFIFAFFITTLQAALVVTTPSELIVIPKTGISFLPSSNCSSAIFYNDFWWTPQKNGWRKARLLEGPWEILLSKNIPSDFILMPKNYREVYEEKISIDYYQWREKYLDKEHHHD